MQAKADCQLVAIIGTCDAQVADAWTESVDSRHAPALRMQSRIDSKSTF